MPDLMKMYGDKTEDVYCAELALLRRIAETSHDMIEGRYWDEFRMASGGQEKLNKAHEDAVREYKQWMADGVG